MKDFFNIKLPKYVIYAFYVMAFFTLINSCNGCKANKENMRLRKEITELKSNTYNKEELNIRVKINNLESEKSTLHNMNEIVLQNVRPAKRINEIDLEIIELQQKLASLPNGEEK